MKIKVCPRCGKPIDWIERQKVKTGSNTYRTYIIAVHVDKKTEKRKKCYLGPEEGYVLGNITHKELGGLEGLEDVWNRNKSYLGNLLESFTKCQNPKIVREVIEIIKSSLPKLEAHLHTLKSLEVTSKLSSGMSSNNQQHQST
jgi:hypothetical protein